MHFGEDYESNSGCKILLVCYIGSDI